MTQEEKAKAYDEALERARKQKYDYQKEFDKTDKNSQLAGILRAGISAIELAFPELAENEDERIRKALIEVFKKKLKKGFEWVEYGIPNRSVLDWLEKRKEQKHSLNFDAISSWLRDHASRYVNGEFNEFHHCVEYDGTINVEKLIADLKVAVDGGAFDAHEQKEQRSAEWTGEDERIRKEIINFLRSPFVTENITDEKIAPWITYLEKQKEQKPADSEDKFESIDNAFRRGREVGFREGVESVKQSAEWSEDDSRMLSDIVGYITGTGSSSGITKQERADFLYGLSKRFNLQPKQEWSEEDEDKLYQIIETLLADKEIACRDNPQHYDVLCKAYDEQIAWLKSLRPSWKPSEEQMQYLLAVINDPNNAGAESCHLILESLYNDLKKL